MSNLRLVVGKMVNEQGKSFRKKIGRNLKLSVIKTKKASYKLPTIYVRRQPHKLHNGIRIHPRQELKWWQKGKKAS